MRTEEVLQHKKLILTGYVNKQMEATEKVMYLLRKLCSLTSSICKYDKSTCNISFHDPTP